MIRHVPSTGGLHLLHVLQAYLSEKRRVKRRVKLRVKRRQWANFVKRRKYLQRVVFTGRCRRLAFIADPVARYLCAFGAGE